MSSSNYTYTRVFIQEDNFSYTRYADLPKKVDCGEILPPGVHLELCDWNGSLCGNDRYYSQPLLIDDKIHLQFKFINQFDATSTLTHGWRDAATPTDYYISMDIIKEDGTLISSDIDTWAPRRMVARTIDGVDFQNIIIDVDSIPLPSGESCFMLKIGYQIPGGLIVYYYSEPYEIITCESSMLLEGTYTNKDFDNNIYTEGDIFLGTENFEHQAIRRFRGYYERNEVKVTKTLNDSNFVTNIESDDIYDYILAQMPPYEASNLKTIVSGIDFYVDGVQHTDVTGFKKNNEANRMWRPKFTSTKPPDDPNANPANGCIN